MSRAQLKPEPSSLYPDDKELAQVLLGDRASQWPRIVQIEERHGFPRVDPLYGGRYWPAVLAFFERRLNMLPSPQTEVERDEGEGFDGWRSARAKAAKAAKR